MNPDSSRLDWLIWATRGRFWGFRFLLNGGLIDPLAEYEGAFAGLGDEPVGWRRAAESVAMRFSDPLGRRDSAGRVIPHEFVVSGERANEIHSLDDGIGLVWPLVADAYAQCWDSEAPPSLPII